MLLNGTWRQHKTLTINTAQTGHTRALDTERDSKVTHGALYHGVCVHISNINVQETAFTKIFQDG